MRYKNYRKVRKGYAKCAKTLYRNRFYRHGYTDELTGLPIEVDRIGLLDAGDGKIINANMWRQCGAIVNYIGYILSS